MAKKFSLVEYDVTINDESALIIDTCSQKNLKGDFKNWTWCNPVNRILTHHYEDVTAVSVECLWQGTKIFSSNGTPDVRTLSGEWERAKLKKPLGSWAGFNRPLITKPGEARRRIYLPAYRKLITYWLENDQILDWIGLALKHPGPVYLKDRNCGCSLDDEKPLSHAWILIQLLNTGTWPE